MDGVAPCEGKKNSFALKFRNVAGVILGFVPKQTLISHVKCKALFCSVSSLLCRSISLPCTLSFSPFASQLCHSISLVCSHHTFLFSASVQLGFNFFLSFPFFFFLTVCVDYFLQEDVFIFYPPNVKWIRGLNFFCY
ncbi:hypothetical protein RYX36_032492 [Vicia faba]